MNYVFLDFDGVLNNKRYNKRLHKRDWSFCYNNFSLFKKLYDILNIQVILSTGWRRDLKDINTPKDYIIKSRNDLEETNVDYFLRMFKENNIKISGMTDTLYQRKDGWDRLGQIKRYIDKNLKEDDNYVILDDEDIFEKAKVLTESEEKMRLHFVKTKSNDAFVQNDFDKCLKILGKNI